MPNNFRKYPLKQEQFKDFQALLYKVKVFQGLEFLFPNSRILKDFNDILVYYIGTSNRSTCRFNFCRMAYI
jgi:hypothetical protein